MEELDDTKPLSTEMHRHDSGYESNTTRKSPPGTGFVRRRTPTTHTASSVGSSRGKKPRPSIRRAAKSTSVTRQERMTPVYTQSSHITVPLPFLDHVRNGVSSELEPGTRTAYFQFPALAAGPDPEAGAGTGIHTADATGIDSTSYSVPPQTTHYWTSDRTRRLEYAAIDAASQGFRGWMMRYVIPDCFVPKASRRVTFDDDTGSVRRYRIELESDESTEKDSSSQLYAASNHRRRS